MGFAFYAISMSLLSRVLLCTERFYGSLRPEGLLVELDRTSVYDLALPKIPSADYALISGLWTLL